MDENRLSIVYMIDRKMPEIERDDLFLEIDEVKALLDVWHSRMNTNSRFYWRILRCEWVRNQRYVFCKNLLGDLNGLEK